MSSKAIAMMSDRGIFPAAVFLAWKLSQMDSRDDIEIVVFSDWKEGIAEACRLAPRVVFLECDFNVLDFGTHDVSFWERTAYFRFCVPTLLPHIARLLYIDIDMFPMSSKVFDLLDLNMHGKPVAAMPAIEYSKTRMFNSGTLLIDAEQYRQKNMERDAFQRIRDKKELSFVARDQLILNEMFKKNWLALSPMTFH